MGMVSKRLTTVLAGTLDRYPRLRLIIGHMGEMLRPSSSTFRFMFIRTLHLKPYGRPISPI
jgi:predicted TIM-barrel fold metal-dependent hydrolase